MQRKKEELSITQDLYNKYCGAESLTLKRMRKSLNTYCINPSIVAQYF